MAEFNAFTDVEAIHLVYKALQDHIVMIPYETVFTASEEYVKNLLISKRSIILLNILKPIQVHSLRISMRVCLQQ